MSMSLVLVKIIEVLVLILALLASVICLGAVVSQAINRVGWIMDELVKWARSPSWSSWAAMVSGSAVALAIHILAG
jgi:hypothetical protein